ncbi:MAG: hypothetical protein K0R76_1436 [Alphaproteobacteria bacterium]|nr:hypothetical protein [Alphaproteobacteria bacterium]
MLNKPKQNFALMLFLIGISQTSCGDPGSLEAINSASKDRRNIVGIQISTADDIQKARTGCKEGVYVNAVIPHHPADIAGLKEGDIITEIGSTRVRNISEGLMAINSLEAGIKHPFKVCRKTTEGVATLQKNVLIEKVQERAIAKIS